MLKDIFAGLLLGSLTLTTLPAQTQYERGPRGGCYEVTKNGKKSVKRSLCDSQSASQAKSADAAPSTAPPSQTQPKREQPPTSASGAQASSSATPPAQKTK